MKNAEHRIFRAITASALLFSIAANLPAQSLTLLFAGDAMQHQRQIDNALRNGKYDYSCYFQYLKNEISAADLAFVNLEVALAGKPYAGYPRFSAPDEFAVALKEAGFDVFLLANNHILDRFTSGLIRTANVLDSLQDARTGAFKDDEDYQNNNPLIIESKGFRLAVLNYTYGTNGYKATPPARINLIDRGQILSDIKKAKAFSPDAIIAVMHWGIEYKLHPNAEQKSLAMFLADAGVDLIIGSHPHVVQPSEVFADSFGRKHAVVYSLGNLVSAMYLENSVGGQLIKIILDKTDGRTEIKSCQYSLFYVHQKKADSKTDFIITPISLAETPNPVIDLDSVSYRQMTLFAENARALFDECNNGVEEYFLENPF
ncbi:MAG: CapA family protein [Dysgonamonadaceae bacterium]|jgi:poly-gamma-glutamate synthesis protein (capsule biosynthesis protein)|nr:CapA family protein [Dysgonamonadaceae bacterium]